MGRHGFDTTVVVPMVVPANELHDPLARLVLAGEGATRIMMSILHRSEQGYGGGVVVRHPWPGKGSEHTQLLQPAFQRGRRQHFEKPAARTVPDVGMENQGVSTGSADPLSQAGSAHQIGCDGWILALGDIPGHNFATPDVYHQIEVQPNPANSGGEIGDVLTPELVRGYSPEPWNVFGILWWTWSAAPLDLAVGVEHSVKAALRDVDEVFSGGVEQPLIGKRRHDLPWRR